APGREASSPEEASRMAPITDDPASASAATYYQRGGAVALALDLSLRRRSGGRVTLDDYMRAMWLAYGRSGGVREGYVDHPYTMADAEARLGEVSGDPAYARDFFARFIHGREILDLPDLLAQAGL